MVSQSTTLVYSCRILCPFQWMGKTWMMWIGEEICLLELAVYITTVYHANMLFVVECHHGVA